MTATDAERTRASAVDRDMTDAQPPAPYEATDDLGSAVATDGLVVVDGPGATALTLTPDAAEKVAQALVEAAREARAQTPAAK